MSWEEGKACAEWRLRLRGINLRWHKPDNGTPGCFAGVAGMMVGNAMTVTGVTLKRMREDMRLQHARLD
jgi:hypothetical protein